jgi:hypothetical protein
VSGAKDKIVALSRQPILLWQVAAGIAALVVLAMVVMRAGNDPGIGVSGLELKVRGPSGQTASRASALSRSF